MKKKTRGDSYSMDFKQEAVRRMAEAKTIIGLAKELGISRKLLYQWRDRLQAGGRAGLERRRGRPPGSSSQIASPPAPSAADLRIAQLERLLGRKQLEVDFLRTSLRASQGSSVESYQRWRQGIYRSIEVSLSFEGVSLTVEQQCQLAEVSRAGFYRYLQQTVPEQADLLLRARLQELAVAHHRLRGYRMLTALLRREGHVVNHKRVLRLMREDNLLSLRREKYVFTTDSAHSLPIYPNLARHTKLTALNQLWVADITFIRLRSEFIYLAVVLDAYSRRVIGWDLGRTLHAELATRALQMALSERSWKAGELIHHSDRGVQYASSDYIDLLEQGEIQISMSRRGNPYDNARAERFMRTLKEEEIHGSDYRDLEDARSRIGEFLEQVYNRQRLHSALRYLTPEEFEQASKANESDGSDGSGGKPTTGLPPLPQALEIPSGFPHSGGPATAYR